jgi:hypothetical protein
VADDKSGIGKVPDGFELWASPFARGFLGPELSSVSRIESENGLGAKLPSPFE